MFKYCYTYCVESNVQASRFNHAGTVSTTYERNYPISKLDFQTNLNAFRKESVIILDLIRSFIEKPQII